MRIDINLWDRAIKLERFFRYKHEFLTRKIISNELQVSDYTSRFLLSALENKDVISKHYTEYIVQPGVTLVLSDIHIPYQDIPVIDMVLDYAKTKNINRIILLGDLIDFYKVSSFIKRNDRKDTKTEMIECYKFLCRLRNLFPDAEIIYLYGNHEERLERHVLQNAPELFDFLENLIPTQLKLKDLNIQYQTKPFKIGALWYLHGHEKGRGGNPEYITNVIWKHIHDNFICGHFHRQQEKTFPHITRKRYHGAVVGWLGNPEYADYAKLKTDIQGFATVTYDTSGYFQIKLKKIIEGRIL